MTGQKNNTGQVEPHKPVKIRSKTGKGEFTNQHQNGSRSTEGTHKKEPNLAPPSRTPKKPQAKKLPEKQPEGTSELRDHYVAEFVRTRRAKPEFGKAWGRAVVTFGKLISDHGLDASKAIVTRALEQPATTAFTPLVDPWDIAKRANSLKGDRPKAPTNYRSGRTPPQNTGVDVFAGAKVV